MAQSKAVSDLLERARSLMPDYTTCRVCGKPLWNIMSVERGVGAVCELKEAVQRAERRRLAPFAPMPIVEFRGQQRRVKAG